MRKTFIRIITCIMVMMTWSGCKNGDKLPYQNESLSIEKRVDDLLDRLTVNEKIDLMRATSPANERLGFPKYYHGNEALHGVVRPGRFTVFPQAIGLAAMWDTELMQNISTVISDEARARWNELEQGANQKEQFSDLLTFWSPTINMARDPRWGRTPETYGEDPFLTGEMGNISEKQLREYYLPAYEACVRRGGAASIMSAYNSINGIPCTANPWLLTKLLRDEWGFKGYVVSDCGGVHLIQSGHHFVREKLTAATLALKAGLDLECGDDCYIEPLQKAYELGMVSDEDINRAARRILTARMRLGFFDAPESCPYSKISPDVIGSSEHQQMALQAAREAIVLLKNEGSRLLYQAMKELKPEYRRALTLLYFDGLSHDEIALAMGMSKRQIYSILKHGKETLKKTLERKGISDAQY